MARATILESLGAGLYRIQLHFDNSRIDAQLTHMATKIADYAAELAALEPDKTTKTAALNAALTALNDYINATDPAVYVSDPTDLNALNKATWTARGELDVILHDEKLLKLKKAALEKETAMLNKLCPSWIGASAWCVDYVENLTGETEAIVCDHLLWRDAGNQIQHDTGVWLPAATTPPTTALVHPLGSSEHAAWFNIAMLPAAQRHAGRYRIASISNINYAANTCTIDINGRSSVSRSNGKVLDDDPILPELSGHQSSVVDNVQIVYGSCNATAFWDGDMVIVDLSGPTVIGFHHNPRSCQDVEPGSPVGNLGSWEMRSLAIANTSIIPNSAIASHNRSDTGSLYTKTAACVSESEALIEEIWSTPVTSYTTTAIESLPWATADVTSNIQMTQTTAQGFAAGGDSADATETYDESVYQKKTIHMKDGFSYVAYEKTRTASHIKSTLPAETKTYTHSHSSSTHVVYFASYTASNGIYRLDCYDIVDRSTSSEHYPPPDGQWRHGSEMGTEYYTLRYHKDAPTTLLSKVVTTPMPDPLPVSYSLHYDFITGSNGYCSSEYPDPIDESVYSPTHNVGE